MHDSDLNSLQETHSIAAGKQNTQANKYMKLGRDYAFNKEWLITNG